MSYVWDCYEFLKRRFFLISWISLVTYLFYDTFIYYKHSRQFFYLRQILGLGLCVSRGTAAVLNLCSALVLLPLCKKLNQAVYWALTLWPGVFFFWLERAKSFHMTVAVTLLLFAVIHSISHLNNMWNFSRNYEAGLPGVNFATYSNESPILLLLSHAGLTGIAMLIIVSTMGLMSLRVVRLRLYNCFWYTHQLYLPFMVLLIIHPLSGALKQEVLEDGSDVFVSSQSEVLHNQTSSLPKFAPIKSKTWLWMALPLSFYLIDLLWRLFSRNRARVEILHVTHMAGRTMSLTMSCPCEKFKCKAGQYILLQCSQISFLEWHPFTVVTVPTSSHKEIVVWIRVRGDWTENLEKYLTDDKVNKLNILVDGPLSSPMESVASHRVSLCVAAGVGITPFVALLTELCTNPRRRLPGRIHLLWILRHEHEITWLAELATKCILELRNANRPDRLHFQLYVTNNSRTETQKNIKHVIVNERGKASLLNDDKFGEKQNLLTPHGVRKSLKRHEKIGKEECADSTFDIAKEYPILGCRVNRGRPHWDRVFGYWVHLYPREHLHLFCCGPKKLVKILKNKCAETSSSTKTNITLRHEGFS